MMNSAIVIVLAIVYSNGVWAYTIPTTLPPTTGPTTLPPTTEPYTSPPPTTGPYTSPPPTTEPDTSPPPQVCYVNGVSIAVGQMYEDKHAGYEVCGIYICEIPPYAYYATSACYDSTTDTCVTYGGTQIKDGCKRECSPNRGPHWVEQDCGTTFFTTPPPPTTTPPPTTPPPPPPPTTNQIPDGCISETEGTPPTPPPPPGCNFSGVQVPYGPIPNSGGCVCDSNSGYVMCP